MAKILQPILSAILIFSYTILAAQSVNNLKITKEKQFSFSDLLDTPRKIKSLSVGDKVPDIQFDMLNYKKSTAKLSDFNGKFVILDFWATWCYSCINRWPHLDSLQKEFEGSLQILLVNSKETTGDDRTKIMQFFDNREIVNNGSFSLPTVVEDSIANKFFPHFELPHYVWINTSGIVEAITYSDEVNDKNIRRALKKEKLELAVKKDFFPDQIDLENLTPITDDLISYSFFRKGKLEGLNSIDETRAVKSSDGKGLEVRGLFMRNVSLLDIYERAVQFKKKFWGLY